MKILLIRHGEPDYSIDSLTPKGWREAELLADRLCRMDIDGFYLSPLGRAQDTARETLRRLGRKAETLAWLAEFRGQFTDPETGKRRYAWDLKPQYWTRHEELYDPKRWIENEAYASGDSAGIYRETAEGLDSLLARYGYARDGVLYRTEANTDRTIALFCHFGVAMNMLAHLTGMAMVPMMHAFLMPPSSVTTLITEEREKGQVFFRCWGLGDTSHLYAANEPVSQMGLFHEVYGRDEGMGAKAE
ncbi:MAG: histidine phosphatase family protein [Clostridiales bacterium]|nr:histidine phosphatase family protein [Clostridiales bacterium]